MQPFGLRSHMQALVVVPDVLRIEIDELLSHPSLRTADYEIGPTRNELRQPFHLVRVQPSAFMRSKG